MPRKRREWLSLRQGLLPKQLDHHLRLATDCRCCGGSSERGSDRARMEDAAPNIRVNRIFHSSSVMFGYSEPTLGPMAPSIWLSHFSAIL